MTSTYQAWLNKDREWISAYCSRTRKSSLTKVVPLTLLLTALVLGGMGLLNGGGAVSYTHLTLPTTERV